MADQITKTGLCDSCGNERVLFATPHHQAHNPKLWWYCEVCKFAHDKEKKVQSMLSAIASQNPAAAEDPQVVAQAHEKAAADILAEKAENDTLAPNEEIVEEPAPATIPTAETVPSEEAPVEEPAA